MEYVKQEAKLVYLLECLQKTAPPVLVFAEKTKDVDDVHEYLLVKGVEAVAVHGGKDQEDRNLAIDGFKAGRKDVLVATDVASKGLDFPDIQHVINFDMPEEIENYVHRYVAARCLQSHGLLSWCHMAYLFLPIAICGLITQSSGRNRSWTLAQHKLQICMLGHFLIVHTVLHLCCSCFLTAVNCLTAASHSFLVTLQ